MVSRLRSHTGGNQPCSGSETDTKSWGTACCLNPTLNISYQECVNNCTNQDDWYIAMNVLTDNVPETHQNHIWVGNANAISKFRIIFSCPKTISSLSMRNSAHLSTVNTKDFDVKGREPNNNQWQSLTSGTLTLTNVGEIAPLETFSVTPITVEEVEFTCLTSYGNYCGLNYIKFT